MTGRSLQRFCLLAITALAFARAYADTGVLIPRDKDAPDPAILSLQEMRVDVRVIDGDARVWITQIFANHTGQIEEGSYVFAMPNGSTVSDFATWDGPVRIPAVILERKRAEELYDQARMQVIDPGLLETGERDGSAQQSSIFTAKIVPIPAYGTKRLELEYHQMLPANDFAQQLLILLRPASYLQQTAKRFRLHVEMQTSLAAGNYQFAAKTFPLKIERQDAHGFSGTFEATDVALSEDFTAAWKLDPAGSDKLAVSTYRNPHPSMPSPDEKVPVRPASTPGFVLAQTLVGMGNVSNSSTDSVSPRTIVLLFDNSLSMQWDKLERSYAALEKHLLALKPADQFNVVLFNQDTSLFQPKPVSATSANVQQALAFIKAARLRGGTDLGKALHTGLEQCTQPGCNLVLFTDGGSDRGATVLGRKIAASYADEWKRSTSHPRTLVFAVGDDANLALLRQIARNDGVLEHVLSTEPIEAKLAAFMSKSVSRPVQGLSLSADPSASLHTLYPLDETVYPGSIASWVGDYETPRNNVRFTVNGNRGGSPLHAEATASLPSESLDHPQLPRLWAQARVNALLNQIARDGETREAIDEIIRLSRRYKFVTPYTSFLAAPRSLLRPRVIRPGDPVLRVHTDPAITSVIALFPFGLSKPLRHMSSEDRAAGDPDHVWETRFLAPPDMRDGTYKVRLLLRDRAGQTYREEKTFVIASTPPTVKVNLDRKRVRVGKVLQLKVNASASTRTLIARLPGAGSSSLHWSSSASASIGQVIIPEGLAPGTYPLTVTAEDFAHNVGSEEVQIEIVP